MGLDSVTLGDQSVTVENVGALFATGTQFFVLPTVTATWL